MTGKLLRIDKSLHTTGPDHGQGFFYLTISVLLYQCVINCTRSIITIPLYCFALFCIANWGFERISLFRVCLSWFPFQLNATHIISWREHRHACMYTVMTARDSTWETICCVLFIGIEYIIGLVRTDFVMDPGRGLVFGNTPFWKDIQITLTDLLFRWSSATHNYVLYKSQSPIWSACYIYQRLFVQISYCYFWLCYLMPLCLMMMYIVIMFMMIIISLEMMSSEGLLIVTNDRWWLWFFGPLIHWKLC